jgi:LacI family transcriptional regulator
MRHDCCMTRPHPDRPATIYDVAVAAGVSHQTVSRVLRGVDGIRPETRERVQAELARLRYRPNVGARELARARQRRIGVVGYETFESSTSKVLRGVNEVAERAGYRLDIVNVDPTGDVATISAALESLNGTDVAGVLATSPTRNVREALEHVEFRMPVFFDVTGDQIAAHDGEPARSIAAGLVMSHLAELGHDHVAFIAGPEHWDSAINREAVYRERMLARGLEPMVVGRGDWSAASGYRAAQTFDPGSGATAVFVANDRMALGALRALAERGIRVPDDVSVAGIDDIPEAAYFSPPLTTVHIDFTEGGHVAARSLISLIETPDAPLPEYPASVLTVRESTAQVR